MRPSAEAEPVLRDGLQLRNGGRIQAKPGRRPSVSRCSSMTTRVTALASATARSFVSSTRFCERLGEGAEAVAHAGGDLVDVRLRARLGKLLVDGDLLRDLRDVVVRDEGVELHVDHGFAPLFQRRAARPCRCGDRFGQQFAVRLEADRADEARLRRAEQVAGAANLEIAHRDLQARSEMRELADRFRAAPSRLRSAPCAPDKQIRSRPDGSSARRGRATGRVARGRTCRRR